MPGNSSVSAMCLGTCASVPGNVGLGSKHKKSLLKTKRVLHCFDQKWYTGGFSGCLSSVKPRVGKKRGLAVLFMEFLSLKRNTLQVTLE